MSKQVYDLPEGSALDRPSVTLWLKMKTKQLIGILRTLALICLLYVLYALYSHFSPVVYRESRTLLRNLNLWALRGLEISYNPTTRKLVGVEGMGVDELRASLVVAYMAYGNCVMDMAEIGSKASYPANPFIRSGGSTKE